MFEEANAGHRHCDGVELMSVRKYAVFDIVKGKAQSHPDKGQHFGRLERKYIICVGYKRQGVRIVAERSPIRFVDYVRWLVQARRQPHVNSICQSVSSI